MIFDCYAMYPSCLISILAWHRQKGCFCFLYMQESWHTAQLERSLPGFVVQKENVLCRSDMPKSGTSLVLTVSMERAEWGTSSPSPVSAVPGGLVVAISMTCHGPGSQHSTTVWPVCIFLSFSCLFQTLPSTIFLILEGTQMPLPC